MPTSTNVTNLKINELTEAQFDSAVSGGVIGANELSILTDVDAGQVIQVSTMPTASADELGKIYQFVGTTDANYTNGYFYKCTGAGEPVVYSWSRVDVQPSGLVNTATSSTSLFVSDATGLKSFNYTTVYGRSATANNNAQFSTVYGYGAKSQRNNGTAIGFHAVSNAQSAIQIGSSWSGTEATNSDANTLKVGNDNGNFEMMSADGTIPADRLVHAINKYSTMPTAASTNEGWIVQYTGTTDATYTHGHIYECVSDGGNPATYSWTEVSMGGGGSSYTAGTGIDITGGVISVTAPTLQNGTTISGSLSIQNNSVAAPQCVAIGTGRDIKTTQGTIVGYNSYANKNSDNAYMTAFGSDNTINNPCGLALGNRLTVSANYAIQMGYNATNSDANTLKVGNANGNFEIMSADGTIPTDRLTKVNTTITLAAADWSSNTQTVNVTGMTATGVVMVSPDPTDQSAYTSAGILCTAQAAGTLTFTCDTVPSADIDVNVVML